MVSSNFSYKNFTLFCLFLFPLSSPYFNYCIVFLVTGMRSLGLAGIGGTSYGEAHNRTTC